MFIPHELIAVGGLAVIGHIGESVILEMGKKTLATYWSIILYIAAGVMTIRYFWEGTKAVGAIFQVYF